MNEELKDEMSSMCNIGEAIRRKGREEGHKECRKEGREEGRKEGREEGHKEGRKEGRAEGETRLSALMSKLFSLDRFEDAKRCTDDPDYREKLICVGLTPCLGHMSCII